MKLMQRFLSALLALVLVTGMIPALAAEARQPDPEVILEVPTEAAKQPLRTEPRRNAPDSDTLLEGYLEQAFYGTGQASLFGSANRESLDFAQKQLYDAMKRWFQDVAAGRQSSSDMIFHLTLSAAQLGIPSVYTVIEDTAVPSDALMARLSQLDDSRRTIYNAVSDDSPYDTYWIDSSRSWWYTGNYVEDIYPEAELVKFACRWQFPVSASYADPAALTPNGYFRADVEKTGKNSVAAAAGENARRLVEQNRDLGDFEKLEAYKHYICTQVTYDHQAAQDMPNDVNGSGPWEVINVFDENPDTNVVCAGYGKAFQYLCDLSEFQAEITCYQASGDMVGSGPHLWNIVDVDGVQLLADITCVDQDKAGIEEPSCFLATVVPWDEGYIIQRNGREWIRYGDSRFHPARTEDRIAQLSFRMQTPAAGAEAVTAMEVYGGKAGITWVPALKDGKFAPLTAYEARLTLIPTVAPFDENMHLRINGADIPCQASSAGMRKTCTLTFPATGSLDGWIQEADGWKYRDAQGNILRSVWADIDGSRYHFDDQGFRQTGLIEDAGKTYYLDDQGRMTTGWQEIGGKKYYFAEDGAMARDTWVDGKYVGADGALDPDRIRDAFRDEEGGTRYYDHNGEPVKDQWMEIEGSRYRFDVWGFMMRNCWLEEDGLKCYLGDDGRQVDGWQEIYGRTYYFRNGWLVTDTWVDDNRYVDENGVLQPPTDHWVLIGESPDDWRYRYLHADGTWTASGWEEIDGERYHFDAQGFMEEKWQYIDGEWYYLTRQGLWKDGWMEDGDRSRYLDSNGRAVRGWQVINGNRYYFDENAFQAVLWQDIDGRRYYFSDQPGIYGQPVTSWQELDGHRYYFDGDGAMQTGWQDIAGERYYFGTDGILVTDAWVDGHYLGPDGTMDPDRLPPSPPAAFLDVAENAYYANAVNWAVANGITAGTGPTTFSPDAPCIRKQVVTFLWRACGKPEPGSWENPFVDVGESPYQKAILWAYYAGITAGVDDSHFGPDEPCSRKQIVAFLWRSEGKPEPHSMDNPFLDVPADYFRKPILWAVDSGVTAGTSADTFTPNQTCTRAQIVSFLYRSARS